MESQKVIRSLVLLGMTGIVSFAVCILALHAIQRGMSPLTDAMSYYVHGPYGWLTSVGLTTLGVGSLAMTFATTRVARGRGVGVGVLFLTLWSLGAILGGIFAADPPGNWNKRPSTSGAIHGIAAMIALSSFPVACVAVTRNLRGENICQRESRVFRALAFVVVGSFVAFMASLLPVFFRPGPPILLGLSERIMFVAYVAWLLALALELFRMSTAK